MTRNPNETSDPEIGDTNSVPDSSYVPGNILRVSVLALESPKTKRRIVIFLYCSLSLIFTFLSPVSVLRRAAILPEAPNTSRLNAAIDEYENFTKTLNEQMYQDIFTKYQASMVYRENECNSTLNQLYREQEEAQQKTFNFASNYCKNFKDRFYHYVKYVAKAESPGCSDSLALFWFINTSISNPFDLPCVDDFNNGLCVFGLMNTTLCINSNVQFDSWKTLFKGSRNRILCNLFEEKMTQLVSSNLDEYMVGFTQSVRDRLDYDYSYFIGVRPGLGVSSRASLSMDANFVSIQNRFQQWEAQFSVNAAYLNKVYDAWSKVYALKEYVPSSWLGVSFSRPDVSYPSIPYGFIDTSRTNFAVSQPKFQLFRDYNPPEVVFPSEKPEFSVSKTDLVYNPPELQLKSSQLIANLTLAIENLLELVKNFELFDLLLKIAFFLTDLSFLLLEIRRDMSTTVSKFKGVLAFILGNSVYVFYFVLFIIVSVLVSRYVGGNISLSSAVSQELISNCNNAVLIQNSKKLAAYQNEVLDEKNLCDMSIGQENQNLQKIDDVNRNISQIANSYEAYYQSVPAPFSSSFLIDIKMNMTSFPPLKKGAFQSMTPIEKFQIPSEVCSQSGLADFVGQELAFVISESAVYVIDLLIVAFGLTVVTRTIMAGLRNFWWMELTKGYTFDEEFKSRQVKSKIFSRKIQGIVLWVFAAGTMIALISIVSSLKESSHAIFVLWCFVGTVGTLILLGVIALIWQKLRNPEPNSE